MPHTGADYDCFNIGPGNFQLGPTFLVISSKFLTYLGKNFKLCRNHIKSSLFTSSLSAQPWQNPKQNSKSPFFPIKINFSYFHPTGHCPNATMASPPLATYAHSEVQTTKISAFYIVLLRLSM